MRLLHILIGLLALPWCATSNTITEADRQFFIDNYVGIAIEEMKSMGVPASITLAQAILESNWGNSDIAQMANNYFCIKSNNGWEGASFKAKDDEPGLSSFRKYPNSTESFRDHSKFLRENSRYQKLFDLDKMDYESWAKGLQEYGYATDKAYAERLIVLIEDYGLWLYDYAVPADQFEVLATAEMDEMSLVKEEADVAEEPFQYAPATWDNAPAHVPQSPAAAPNYAPTADPQPSLAVPMFHFEKNEIGETTGETDGRFEPNKPRKVKIRPILPHPVLYFERE